MHNIPFEECFREKTDFNQYWYSAETIAAICDEILDIAPTSVAFLSTPSLFFATHTKLRNATLFEFDAAFESKAGQSFALWDFRYPSFDRVHSNAYDMVIMDPPFIDSQVIEAYIGAFHILARGPGCRLLLTSTLENGDSIQEYMRVPIHVANFLPRIPNLVYQYRIFVNYVLREESPLRQSNELIKQLH